METNNLFDSNVDSKEWDDAPSVEWDMPNLKIVRLRLLSDIGFPFWDVSYCYGKIQGKAVRVQLPFSQLPKKGMKNFIVKQAQKYKVFAKGLGILDDSNISTLK